MLSSIEFSTTEKKNRDTGEEEEAARRMNQGRLIIMRFILMIQVPPIMEKGRPEEGKL